MVKSRFLNYVPDLSVKGQWRLVMGLDGMSAMVLIYHEEGGSLNGILHQCRKSRVYDEMISQAYRRR